MVEGKGTMPVKVSVEEIGVVSAVVSAVVSGVVSGEVTEVITGAVPVGTNKEVVLAVGIGYGLDSTDVEIIGVELGTGGLDEAGPQLKPTL